MLQQIRILALFTLATYITIKPRVESSITLDIKWIKYNETKISQFYIHLKFVSEEVNYLNFHKERIFFLWRSHSFWFPLISDNQLASIMGWCLPSNFLRVSGESQPPLFWRSPAPQSPPLFIRAICCLSSRQMESSARKKKRSADYPCCSGGDLADGRDSGAASGCLKGS
ncbi:hypothetical protein CEXT_482921 [Caerostris extrusa]|uniref:Uncharacterized protein n=1 Tax=Caerostris extrusa TaxID=172846 RepID=A0AAV4RZ37_CAEEX|nr:hypothetical protein CEXT_482921 [Caerostris extrusa]